MRHSLVSAIVVYAAQSAAYWEEYLDTRDLNDMFEYNARGFEDGYDLGPRDFDNSYLVSRDFNDDYAYAPRSYEPDDSLHARDISFVAAGFQPRDLFHSDIGNNWYRPTVNPLGSLLNKLSSPAHRDHSHILFQNNHAFMVPPQHDHFNNFFDTFLPPLTLQNSHNTVMAHASVSNTGSGYSCTSSTVIGLDGIPHTTKHCSNTTPDSHVSITVGPSSDSDSDFFSDPFADLFTSTDSHSNWHDSVFGDFHTASSTPKLLRNKRILDLDAAPHRGEIHSFSDGESEYDHDHADHAEEHDEHGHGEEHEKHELRDGDVHEHEHEHEHDHDSAHGLGEKKEKRDAEAEAEAAAVPEANSDSETLANTK